MASLWDNDCIQFPRLLAEIAANVATSPADTELLCASMDISVDELNELFDRADAAWERIKYGTVGDVAARKASFNPVHEDAGDGDSMDAHDSLMAGAEALLALAEADAATKDAPRTIEDISNRLDLNTDALMAAHRVLTALAEGKAS